MANHPPTATAPVRLRLFGAISFTARWGLTLKGWATLFLLSASIGLVTLLHIHSFLSKTEKVDSKHLVVEGWVQRYAIEEAAKEFIRGGYSQVLTTGGPVAGIGSFRNDYQTTASVGADNLRSAGLPDHVISMVPNRTNGRDRTYSSAIALRDWFARTGTLPKSINVLTEDCHGRRSQLLYQKAFGRQVQVGIISVRNPDYDPKRWWTYSEGVKEVVSESFGYLYARLFFWPKTTNAPGGSSQSGNSTGNPFS